MNIILTGVSHFDKDKDGKELVSKNHGRPYTRCLIKCNEHGEKTLSGFGSDTTRGWSIGDTVDVEIEEKKVGENTYLNFKVVSGKSAANAELTEELRKINYKLDVILKSLSTPKMEDMSTISVSYPENDEEDPKF